MPASDLSTRIRSSLAAARGVALQAGDSALDWGDLAGRVAGIEAGLVAAGIGPGATVAVMGRNDIASATVVLALVASGRCAAIINPFRPAPGALQAARTLRPDAIVLPAADPALDAVLPDDPVLIMSPKGLLVRHTGAGPGQLHPPRTGIIISTSGTTGEPKPMPLALPILSRAMREIEAINAGFGDRQRPTGEWPGLIQYSPLAHIGGALTLLRAAAQGRPAVMLGKFEPELWTQAVEQWRPFTTGLPPSMMRMIVAARIEPARLSSLVSVWSGTAPLRPEDRGAFSGSYGLPVLGNYGATEFCGAIAAWSLDDHREHFSRCSAAVGRIHPHIARARVRGPEGRLLTEDGASGVLEFMVNRIGKRWIRTSDLGSVDRDGFLTLHGRQDDSIIRGGFKLSPGTIAATLRQHPAIRDAAVVGMADDRLGQVPAAAVELENGMSVEVQALQDFVRARLPAYFVPAKIRVVGHLPRNAAMKLDRRAIGALFEEAVR